jgi:hypothetical protein
MVGRIASLVLLRRLLLLLIGLAMGLAPLGMPVAAAAPVAGHQMMSAEHGGQAMDHCGGKSAPGKASDKSCCVATCLGMALAPAAAGEPPELAGAALRAAPAMLPSGIAAELPTPPPRSA